MEITKEECVEPFEAALIRFDELIKKGVHAVEDDEFFEFAAGFFFTAGIIYVATKYGIKTPVTDAPNVHH
jgi:hypothetical protein